MARLRDLSDEDLLLELAHWDQKVREATGWVAAKAAEFHKNCQWEIARRNQPKNDPTLHELHDVWKGR